jgi:hypothetical protein
LHARGATNFFVDDNLFNSPTTLSFNINVTIKAKRTLGHFIEQENKCRREAKCRLREKAMKENGKS